MLYIPRFNHTKSLSKLNFVQRQESEELKIISSQPLLADKIRALLQRDGNDMDVITISQFITSEIKFFLGEQTQVMSKADMLLFFATIWKKFFPEGEYEHFLRSFNLLTDLRSFGLDNSLFESVLEEYDEVLKRAVLIFNEVFKQLEHFDEHRTYNELSNTIREISLDNYHEHKRHLVFQGFQFFTSQQIDFLKALSIRDDIYVCVPERVYKNKKKQDWISWLEDSNSKSMLIDDEIDFDELDVVEFQKSRLNNAVLENKLESADFVFPSKKISFNEINELPFYEANFKSTADLFDEKIIGLSKVIEKEIFYKHSTNCTLFLKYIDEKVKQELSCSEKDFLLLKVYSELHRVVGQWQELSDENNSLELRDFKILLDVLKLNMPRNSFKPLIDKTNNNIFDLTSYEESLNKKVLCVSGAFSSLSSSVSNYPEKVEDYLLSIGPLKSVELELNFLKQSIEDILCVKNNVLLIESGLKEHSEDWNDILENKKIVDLAKSNSSRERKSPLLFQDKFKTEIKSISASKLQNYLDCPQKYYYSYNDKLLPDYRFNTKLMPNQLGELEHKVIEVYFKNKEKESVSEVASKTLSAYLDKHGINLNEDDRKNYSIEIINYSQNAITFVKNWNSLEGLQLFFEKDIQGEIQGIMKRGSIDMFALGPEIVGLVDFKRSSSSIPAKSNILGFEKIQLCFYMNTIREELLTKENYFLGYLNMSSIEDSLFFTNSPLYQDFLNNYEDGKIKNYEIEALPELLDEYSEFEIEKIDKLINEVNFHANPKTDNACDFCELKIICSKGEV